MCGISKWMGFPSQMASNAKNVSIWWRHCHFDGFYMGFTIKFRALNLSWCTLEIDCVAQREAGLATNW